jgi:hypothetical protein
MVDAEHLDGFAEVAPWATQCKYPSLLRQKQNHQFTEEGSGYRAKIGPASVEYRYATHPKSPSSSRLQSRNAEDRLTNIQLCPFKMNPWNRKMD